MGAPVVVKSLAVLEDHRGMEIVFRFPEPVRCYQFLNTAAPPAVAFRQVRGQLAPAVPLVFYKERQ